MGIRSRQMACPWFLWRLAAAAAVDVLAVLAVNRAADPGKLTQPSGAVLSQVPAPSLLVATRVCGGCCSSNAAALSHAWRAKQACALSVSEVMSEVHTGLFVQVLVTLLNALAVGIAMEPFSYLVRSELLVIRSDGGLVAASRPLRCPASAVQSHLGMLWASLLAPLAFGAIQDLQPFAVHARPRNARLARADSLLAACRWSHAQRGSGRPSGPALLAQRLLRQGLQLGLVGLLTGLAGSAAARQLASWQRKAAAKDLQDPGDRNGTTVGGGGASAFGSRAAGKPELRLHDMDILKRSVLQRVLFMALSANVRHAALYAAEDRLCVYAGTPAVLLTARALLHSANSLLAAAQWQHVSLHIYDDACWRN
jgi:hypothetical protein